MRITILKGILRGTLRDRLLSTVNIGGMVIGLTAGILILSYALTEYSVDDFHEASDHIYRVDAVATSADGESTRWADSPFRLRDEIISSFPGAQFSTRLVPSFGVIRIGESVEYQAFSFVDPQFFDLFSFPVLESGRGGILDSPDAIVLTRSLAERFFPNGDAVGQTVGVKLDETFREVTVTAVVEDPGVTSSLYFSALLPIGSASDGPAGSPNYERWLGQGATFVRLADGQDPDAFAASLSTLQDTYGDALLNGRRSLTFSLTPLGDIYFDTTASTRGITRTSNPRTAHSLIGIALLIMAIAAANFTTLSVARSTRHTRVVGIRKSVGASRRQIAFEYLTESVIKTVIAMIFAVGLAELLAPPFSNVTGLVANPAILLRTDFLLVFAGLILTVGILSGAYPALRLSSIRPIGILQGNRIRQSSSLVLRGVVIMQFVTTAVLLTAAWTMSRQIGYMNDIDLGMDAEDVLIVEPDFTNGSTIPAAHAALESSGAPSIASVARSIGMISRSYASIQWDTAEGPQRAQMFSVTPEYLDMLDLSVIAGRTLDPSRPREILVNRPFLEVAGLTEQTAVGALIGEANRISGVVDDFFHHSTAFRLRPLALSPITDDRTGGYLMVKARPDRQGEALQEVRSAWSDVAPDVPLRTYWLDEDLAQQSGNSATWSRIIRAATIFAVLISCLGLFGLSVLTVSRRMKEIGVRKVLGAGPLRVAGLLIRETLVLAAAAVALSIPIGLWFMQNWLDDFANRITIGVGDILALGSILIVVATITVSFQSLRAAFMDPVRSIRHE